MGQCNIYTVLNCSLQNKTHIHVREKIGYKVCILGSDSVRGYRKQTCILREKKLQRADNKEVLTAA